MGKFFESSRQNGVSEPSASRQGRLDKDHETTDKIFTEGNEGHEDLWDLIMFQILFFGGGWWQG
jgi:hypothetical protein